MTSVQNANEKRKTEKMESTSRNALSGRWFPGAVAGAAGKEQLAEELLKYGKEASIWALHWVTVKVWKDETLERIG